MTGVLLERASRPAADAYGRLAADPRGRRILDLLELARGSEVVAFDPHSNFGYSTVQAGSTIIGSTGSPKTVALEIGDGPDFPSGAEFNIVVWPPGTRPLSSNAEIARVTRSGDTLTTTARGQEGTAALSTIAAGYQVMAAVTKKTLTDVEDISIAATTVAGLGTGFAGKRGLVRAGSTPFEFIDVTYDATYGKWVSPIERISVEDLAAGGGGSFADTDAVFAQASAIAGIAIPSYKAILDAGLRLQVRLTLRSVSATTSSMKIAVREWAEADTTENQIELTAAMISALTNGQLKQSAWTELVVVPAESHATLFFVGTADNNTTWRRTTLGLRWVG